MLQQALAGGADIVNRNVVGECKVGGPLGLGRPGPGASGPGRERVAGRSSVAAGPGARGPPGRGPRPARQQPGWNLLQAARGCARPCAGCRLVCSHALARTGVASARPQDGQPAGGGAEQGRWRPRVRRRHPADGGAAGALRGAGDGALHVCQRGALGQVRRSKGRPWVLHHAPRPPGAGTLDRVIPSQRQLYGWLTTGAH